MPSQSKSLIFSLLAGVVVVVSSPVLAADAATAQCQGQDATITGPTPGGEVTGTPGNDVIVTAGAGAVRSMGGDDLICITGPRSYVNVSAGDGNDQVVNQTTASMSVILGPGDDSFTGGPGNESVGIDGFTADLPTGSAGHDIISTGAGSDRVETAAPGEANTDVIDLGEGVDNLRLSPLKGDNPKLTGGGGFDSLLVRSDSNGSWAIDNVQEQLTRDGTTLANWAGFEDFYLFVNGPQSFRGGPGNERVHFESADRAPARASMGDGDDSIGLTFWSAVVQPGSALAAGAGRDTLYVEATDDLGLDLSANHLTVGASNHRVTGVEDAELQAQKINARGDGGRNLLDTTGCAVTSRGGGGADVLTTAHRRTTDGRFCLELRARGPHKLYGQGGNDRLVGGSLRDELLGGAGRDFANGNGGQDLCRAERERHCEG